MMMNRRFMVLSMLGALLAAGCDRRGRRGGTSGGDDRTLNLFAWSEYVPQEVIEGFTRETGIRVNYETYDSNEAMLVKLAQGSTQYDLIQPSEYAVEALIRRGMLEPLDLSHIPNVRNLDPAYRGLPFDPKQQYAVPYMAGTVGIVVNTERVKRPIAGYADVFQPAFKGRIVAINDNREIVSWAFDVLGIPVNEVTEANLARARPLIAGWLPLVKVFDSDNPRAPLISGDCDLGIMYSGDAAKLYEQDHKFAYVLPREGVHEFVDNLCVPRGAPHKDAAEQFINYILRPDVSRRISDKFPYTNPNAEARRLLSKAQRENPASYPHAGQMEVFRDIGDGSQKIGELMTDLRSRG